MAFSTPPVPIRSTTVKMIEQKSPVRDMMNLAEATVSRFAIVSSETPSSGFMVWSAEIRPRNVSKRPKVTKNPGHDPPETDAEVQILGIEELRWAYRVAENQLIPFLARYQRLAVLVPGGGHRLPSARKPDA